ncbi:MAG: hypothetical protein HY584_01740 [Candidatus Omnitrophica bacterium]|nr:hypothetical protein [Candidatus Omnitrophota bacterium]
MNKKIGIGFLIFFLNLTASALAEPEPEALRQTIRDYIAGQEKLQGAFAIADERSGELRQLELVRVHDRVGKTGDYYYSCTDMKDVRSGDLLDLDFDIQDEGGNLSVAAVRIHKDNGNPRYTYDENDNMIPVST